MPVRRISAAIDEEAARWAARLDRGPLEPAEETRLSAWLARDARHLGAYARAQAVLASADRARALGAGLVVPPEARAVSRRRLFGWAAAAAAATVAAVPALRFAGQAFGGRRLETRRGEVQLVSLEDGSRITLDTASRVVTRFDADVRRVELVAGEALFDVARDKARPFIVRAADTEVRAIGTSFSVAVRADGAVRVLVREGLVDVRRLRSAAVVPVGANHVALVSDAAEVPAPTVLPPDEVDRQLAWREGMIAFENERLDVAIAQFARYSDTPIRITDPELAERRISGWFSSSDPRGFARAAALSLDARLRETPEGMMLGG
jgi:transmembrane sensor